ncbi:MAG: sulfatase-like hydrolase/transferase [Lachnospiraceae bacterium]|nr:sulfatase-like hydrolase/transferase [Lachnospiraceae bacterium]
MKKKIEEAIINEDEALAKQLLDDYEGIAPEDADLLSLKVNYYIMAGDITKAASYALMGVRRLPLNAEMYYNLACIYEMTGQWLEAFLNYQKAGFLYGYVDAPEIETLKPQEKALEMLDAFMQWKENITDEQLAAQAEQQYRAVLAFAESNYGFYENIFRTPGQVIGSFFYESMEQRRFAGVFKDQFLSKHYPQDNMDLIHLRGEFLRADEGRRCHIAGAEDVEKYLLPIASRDNNNMLLFCKGESKYQVLQRHANHFNYYITENNMDIYAVKDCCFGSPIPMRWKHGKKKLVLNIFLDGMAQSVISDADFKKIMPCTYQFFEKGTICTHAYSAAEWTYPSIANFVTGLDTTHHMLFHSTLDSAMPQDVPTIAEYFKRDGYYTAMFCGDWRIIPTYGHARGYDRYVYQHQKSGYKVHEVIADAIDHLDAFYETNQFVWLSLSDLHDIADEDDLPVDVQKGLPLHLRTYEEKGVTSVKQEYSENKTAAFLKEAAHIDRWLGVLYDYIEKHYAENEIVVSLFSDHGQGYFVKNKEHFLAKGRSNIALMFRGGIADTGVRCGEIISSLDYSDIMRKLADVNIPKVPSDGRLPLQFGGTDKRVFALAESLHPNDPYQAALFMKGSTFFFRNPSPVTMDGRFRLEEYVYWLQDEDGNKMDDGTETEKCLQYILKHIAPLLLYE